MNIKVAQIKLKFSRLKFPHSGIGIRNMTTEQITFFMLLQGIPKISRVSQKCQTIAIEQNKYFDSNRK